MKSSSIADVRLIKFDVFPREEDSLQEQSSSADPIKKGLLAAGKCDEQISGEKSDFLIPFVPRRFFFVYKVGEGEKRGQHAHRVCQQVLIATSGSCRVELNDGLGNTGIRELTRPSEGLYLPPMIWATQCDHTPDCVLTVLASHPYDPEDYIRDMKLFQEEKEKESRPEG